MSALIRFLTRVLDILIPPRCLLCGAVVDRVGALCPPCWEAVDFIGPPYCACCGQPFDLDPGAGTLCGSCIAKTPRFARARAVFRYTEASRALILRFKRADRTGGAATYGRWMARAGAELLAEADLIVPVPLHRLRLLKRRYNQSALLANELARLSGKATLPDALIRTRHTPFQSARGRRSRAANVRGAFRLSRPKLVMGKRVLLIDDVHTSGATLNECAKILLAGGATAVDVLTLSRVIRAEDF